MADDDAYRATVRAYNDWLGEEYCPVSRDRLIGLGVIPWTNVRRRASPSSTTARGSASRASTSACSPTASRIPRPRTTRFWAAAIDMKMPLTVHVGFDRLGPRASQPTFEYPGADPEVLKKLGPAEDRRVGGAAVPEHPALDQPGPAGPVRACFDRLPDLKIFFAETRLGWVPFWMEEADYWYERHRHWAERLLGFKPLKQPAQRVRAAAHLLQRAARGARGRRAAPPHGRRAHHVRHRLPAHRVRLAEHAPVRRAALRRTCRPTRPSRSPAATCWTFFHLRGHADGPHGAGRRAMTVRASA